ncbi:MAG: c-type cytochrome biogenesis protein CcmI [Acidobacteriota bacterium]|nr:c-type cytochrome biogenesis protein CcmI [Acidobacteriota bacterium]
MIVFWLICAVMVAIALAFVVPALLQTAGKGPDNSDTEANVDVYRDQISELDADLRNGIVAQEQYQHDRDEIERRLLEDVSTARPTVTERPAESGRRLTYAIALGIPLIAIGLYLRVGNPAAISAAPATNVQAPFAGNPADGPMTQQRMESNVAALAQRLEQNPNDSQSWAMLGRSYLTLEKYAEASNAYAKATAVKPDDADLWADYAFALAMANGRRLQGQPQELIAKALKLDPDNPKALELAGSAAFEAKNYKEAVNYWQRLLEKSPPNSELSQTLAERIDRAKSLSGETAK